MTEQERRRARLRELAAQLERLPRTPARTRLMHEVRSRIVAIEVGDDDASSWERESRLHDWGLDRPHTPTPGRD